MFFKIHLKIILKQKANLLAFLLALILAVFIPLKSQKAIISEYPDLFLILIMLFVAFYLVMGNTTKAFLEERNGGKTDITLFYAKSLLNVHLQIAFALTLFIFLADLLIGFAFCAAICYSKNLNAFVFINKDVLLFVFVLLPFALFSINLFSGSQVFKSTNTKNTEMLINLGIMIFLLAISFASGYLATKINGRLSENQMYFICMMFFAGCLCGLIGFSVFQIKKISKSERYRFNVVL